MKKDRFIANSFLLKNFADWESVNMENCAVIIVNAHNPQIIVVDIDNLQESEVKDLVNQKISELTVGCNYNYRIIKKVGNCFFCN